MKKKDNELLNKWLMSIPAGEYQNKISRLSEHCGVSRNVIGFWKQGRTNIKPAYKKLINEFADKKIFET